MLYVAGHCSATCFVCGLHNLPSWLLPATVALSNSVQNINLKFCCWCGSNTVVPVWLSYRAIECISINWIEQDVRLLLWCSCGIYWYGMLCSTGRSRQPVGSILQWSSSTRRPTGWLKTLVTKYQPVVYDNLEEWRLKWTEIVKNVLIILIKSHKWQP
jgi:hypothetical protein